MKNLTPNFLPSQRNDEERATNKAVVPLSEALSAWCKAAGDSLRLEILRILRHNAYGVLELSELFDVKQSGMSHHLKVLANAGLVATRREGNTIFYRRSPLPTNTSMQELHRTLFTAIDQLVISHQLAQRVNEVNQRRTKASRDFFQQNADRFQANQDLIANYQQYGDIVTELLDKTQTHHRLALEVGPGEGNFLSILAKRFKTVIALDNSEEMLSRARQYVQANKLTNVELIHGDTTCCTLSELFPTDCITLNMVLHHTPDPAQIFIDLFKIIAPGGALIVTELCPHGQSWARESCGDLWLGFEPSDLTNWASTAHFTEGESLYLAQRNGFQLQIRQFFKPQISH